MLEVFLEGVFRWAGIGDGLLHFEDLLVELIDFGTEGHVDGLEVVDLLLLGPFGLHPDNLKNTRTWASSPDSGSCLIGYCWSEWVLLSRGSPWGCFWGCAALWRSNPKWRSLSVWLPVRHRRLCFWVRKGPAPSAACRSEETRILCFSIPAKIRAGCSAFLGWPCPRLVFSACPAVPCALHVSRWFCTRTSVWAKPRRWMRGQFVCSPPRFAIFRQLGCLFRLAAFSHPNWAAAGCFSPFTPVLKFAAAFCPVPAPFSPAFQSSASRFRSLSTGNPLWNSIPAKCRRLSRWRPK